MIAIFGTDGAGKSTLARALANHLELPVCPLAEAVRETVFRHCKDLSRAEIWGKPTTPEVRERLIRFGAIGRKADALYWCKQWVINYDKKGIVDDGRYPNEVKFFKDRGYLTVFLDKPVLQTGGYYDTMEKTLTMCDLVIPSKSAPVESMAGDVLSELCNQQIS